MVCLKASQSSRADGPNKAGFFSVVRRDATGD
jgi:hypothetical protein